MRVSDPSGAIATPVNDKDASRETLLEQYKLTLEMASEISTKRQAANNFFIGLLSSFGALYSYLHDKLPESQASGASQGILPILGVAWSIVWLFTIRAYRRINKAKWNVIYDLEQDLSSKPFTWEGEYLSGTRKSGRDKPSGSFAITQTELVVPLLVGFFFLVLAAYPLLHLLLKRWC